MMIADAVRELVGMEPHMALTYFMCVVIGVMMNWAKRARELDVGLIEYWTSNKARSQTAIVGTICAYVFTLITDPESGKLSYIAIGFACDNLLNNPKAGNKVEQVRYAAVLEAAEAKIKYLEGLQHSEGKP